ncbi:SRPBCC family protein [Yinghuangia sp. ASG 101]|uniref:SRPBCC family protein n=1 Tax=Yinghuangia sp. ASG 101 TaxID=2896848 RepID=UPI001E352C31|nr:SRPBCC family protein [Yinghuangia sp. ASG 101]UGQ12761.1 SRPBCC family protein [Yinghuangia sp. ASG 101]
MKLENTFSIPVSAEEAWQVLLDIERIAPCVPGATLTSSEGDTHKGKVKVKLGPIGLTYNGTVTFLSQDADAQVVVLEAAGREMRGNGTAKAQVTCRLVGNGAATDVFVETELAITGKPAQFGRGALAEVSGALIGQFAANLAEELTASAPADAASEDTASAATTGAATPDAAGGGTATASAATSDGTTAPTPGASAPAPEAASGDSDVRMPPRRGAEPLDLLEAAGGGVLKEKAPLAIAAAAALLLLAVGLRRRPRPEIVYVGCCCNPAK